MTDHPWFFVYFKDQDITAVLLLFKNGCILQYFLTCIDSVYDRDPCEKWSVFEESIEDVSSYMEAPSGTNSMGTGGMLTKLQAKNMLRDGGFTNIKWD